MSRITRTPAGVLVDVLELLVERVAGDDQEEAFAVVFGLLRDLVEPTETGE